jgi:hypothetical protein
MRIVVPLTYWIDYVPRRGTGVRRAPFLELLEWEVPEISMSDTSEGIWIRTPILRRDGGISWNAQQWRMLDGGLIREAGRRHGGFSHIQADHLPRYENGRIRSNFIFQLLNDVLNLFDTHEQYNLAHKTMVEMALPGAKLNIPMPAAREIVSNDRPQALAITERILGRLLLVDGVLWKRTREPLLRVSNTYLQFDCMIDYNEDDEKRSCVGELRSGEFTLPLVDWQRVARLEQRKGLPPHVHGAVDSVSEDAPVTRDAERWLARRAAEFLLERTANSLGECEADAIQKWVHLRDLLSEEGVAADFIAGIEVLSDAMSGRRELFAERLHELLDPIDLGETPAPQMTTQQAAARRW